MLLEISVTYPLACYQSTKWQYSLKLHSAGSPIQERKCAYCTADVSIHLLWYTGSKAVVCLAVIQDRWSRIISIRHTSSYLQSRVFLQPPQNNQLFQNQIHYTGCWQWLCLVSAAWSPGLTSGRASNSPAISSSSLSQLQTDGNISHSIHGELCNPLVTRKKDFSCRHKLSWEPITNSQISLRKCLKTLE